MSEAQVVHSDETILTAISCRYDIAFIGAPFDTGTSYRPGARFGPSGIRQGSRRLNLYGKLVCLEVILMLRY